MIYRAFVLNIKGIEHAQDCGVKHVEISVSASEQHSQDNAGMSHGRALGQTIKAIEKARAGECI